jgi:hypothetical protein
MSISSTPDTPQRWLTYGEAAKEVGLTPDSLRHRARREGWPTSVGDDSRARVLIPDDVRRRCGPMTNAVQSIPPTNEARVAALTAQTEELRKALTHERAAREAERDRSNQLAAELLALTRKLAGVA